MAQRAIGGRERPREAMLGAFSALSVLWACGPLRAALLPAVWSASMPRFAAQTMPLGLVAILGATFAFWHRTEWPRGGCLRAAIWIGLGLFALPGVMVHYAAGWVSGLAQTALFALVPVFSIVLEPHLGGLATRPIPGGLLAALAALLGTLLVFPVAIPVSLEAGGAFALVILAAFCVAAANCYAVAAFQNPAFAPAAPMIAVVVSAGALGLGMASLFLDRPPWQRTSLAPELLWAAAVETPSLLLLFWLMRRLSAVRLSTRFVFGPLLIVPIGALLLQIPLATRTWLGLLGMAGGAGYLLLAREPEAEPPTLLGDSRPESPASHE